MSLSYSTDAEKEAKGRMQRDCWMKLKMTRSPAFKLLSASRIGFDFNAVLCGKGTGIKSTTGAT